ncbi:caspase family protein [Bernardetia sp.]|uniref:caspase family protein n=1 Tax=Bernardetia sp. TaxID=1937974 RepID=UPI0025C21EA2|nr:caspase family protein [Bernardetia sp.]
MPTYIFTTFLLLLSFGAFAQYDTHYLKSGNQDLIQENYVQAEENYTTSLKHNSRNMEAYLKRGITRWHLKKYKDAISDLDRAILFNYKTAEANLWKGKSYFAMDSYKESIKYFDKALQLNTEKDAQINAEIYEYKGFAYQKLNNSEKTAENFRLALGEGSQNSAELNYKLATINYLNKDYEASLKNLQLAKQQGHPNRVEISNKIVTLDKLINEQKKANQKKEVKFHFQNPSSLTATVSQPFFDLEVCLESELMVNEVKVFINNKEQDPIRGLTVTPSTKCAITVKRKIPLQNGTNEIRLEATTAQGTFFSQNANVTFLAPDRTENVLASMPKVWAVVVGVASYTAMPTLRYSDDDAYQMYAFLKSPEGGALSDDQITLLVDENATKSQITNSLNQKFSAASENDLVIFYYAGHGLEGSFLPYDYNGTESTKLLHKDIQEIFTSSKAKNKLFIADACHSGSSSENLRGNVKATMDKYYQALANTSGGTALMMSSKAEETSLENKTIRQGVFSYYLIRGLKGEADFNADKIVSVRELFDYVQTQTRQYTNYRQNPELYGLFDPNMPIGAVRK